MTNTATQELIDAIESIRADELNFEFGDDNGNGGWINCEVEFDGGSIAAGWDLFENSYGLSESQKKEFYRDGYVVAAYNFTGIDFELDAETRECLMKELDCEDEDDLEDCICDLWEKHAPSEEAAEAWELALKKRVEKRIEDADIQDLLTILNT